MEWFEKYKKECGDDLLAEYELNSDDVCSCYVEEEEDEEEVEEEEEGDVCYICFHCNKSVEVEDFPEQNNIWFCSDNYQKANDCSDDNRDILGYFVRKKMKKTKRIK